MIIRRVVGNSMYPTIKEGQIVLVRRKSIALGDVVLASLEGREVIKRINHLEPKIVLVGDNKNSARYEDVSESDILGVVLWPKTKI